MTRINSFARKSPQSPPQAAHRAAPWRGGLRQAEAFFGKPSAMGWSWPKREVPKVAIAV
ncbi:hypothetical protein [Novosphingobium organovorum]|uniref:hypothetical protein n=1 Tax=Novosphingobium organovorum TaxID=2930092 RepID=UPI001FB8C49B|nr:hypothetical protein [Novosphingobium organovorum]